MEDIGSLDAQDLSKTKLKRDEGNTSFKKNGTPRSLPKPAQYNSIFIESFAKNKATLNNIDIDSTTSTVLLRKKINVNSTLFNKRINF